MQQINNHHQRNKQFILDSLIFQISLLNITTTQLQLLTSIFHKSIKLAEFSKRLSFHTIFNLNLFILLIEKLNLIIKKKK